MITEVLLMILAMSLAIEGLIEAIFKPLLLKLKIDTWWLFYVAFVIGALVGWFSKKNAFTGWFEEALWLGRLFTAAACGAGPSYLYKLIDNGQAARLPVKIK